MPIPSPGRDAAPGRPEEPTIDQYRCADVVPGCEAGFRADSAVDILRQATAHAWTSHGLAQPHLPAHVTAQVLAAIHPAR